MTFETIVEKTKCMLGKNYRGDTEKTAAYSDLAPVQDRPDIFLSVSNGGFTEEETALIKEKTRNYAWWVANKGYLVDSAKTEIPALMIYGSEIGTITPDVLNFTGLTENNFYLPINKTNKIGDLSVQSHHIYIKFILNDEIIEFETDRNVNSKTIEINGETYELYIGRLYPEDRKIINNNVVYPIYLISNLDYYYIPDIGVEGENLHGAHDTEPVIQNNLNILNEVCELVMHEALVWTNRNLNDEFLNSCWPIIVKCSCIAYLNRGAEGLNSQSELGQQNVYVDWVTLMHKQITNRRYVM